MFGNGFLRLSLDFRRGAWAATVALALIAGSWIGCAGAGSAAPTSASHAVSAEASGEVAVPAAAGAELPDTPVAAAALDWLALYNAGDELAIHTFLLERFTPHFLAELPVQALVAFHVQSLEEFGALVPAAVVETEPHRLLLLADAANGEVMELTLEVDGEEPQLISALRLIPHTEE